MKKLNKFWVARIVIKWLIPVMFFVVANVENSTVANSLAGTMVVIALAYYVMLYEGFGKDKYI